jgi:uncharacterized protein
VATPRLTKHVLMGTLGDILVDVRAGSRADSAPAVVILHGFKGFKDWGMFPPLAERVARGGFTAVSYNASGSGVDDTGVFAHPERFGHNTFTAELHDLGIVLDELAQGGLDLPPPTTTALVGHSRGGGIAILHAARDSRIGALVTWAAISGVERWSAEMRRRWRETGSLEVKNQRTGEVLPLFTDILDDLEANRTSLDVEAHAARITTPWLIIHGAEDETVPVSEAKKLHAAAPAAELFLVENTGHTFGAAHPFQGMTPALEQVYDATTGFLSRVAGH